MQKFNGFKKPNKSVNKSVNKIVHANNSIIEFVDYFLDNHENLKDEEKRSFEDIRKHMSTLNDFMLKSIK